MLGVFNVVEFISPSSKRQISTVPTEWLLTDDQCAWPPFKKQQEIDNAVKCRQAPEKDWQLFTVRILACAGMN